MNIVLVCGMALVFVFGILIAYQGYRAYKRHQSRPMLFTAIGFLFLSIGSVVDCSFLTEFNLNFAVSSWMQTGILITGMGCVLYSIYQ